MNKEKNKKIKVGHIFLIIVIAFYILLFLFNAEFVKQALAFFVDICCKIVPILALVFIFMLLSNLFLNTKKVVKYVGYKSGIKGWLISIAGGILSSGPIYVWYPLLGNLQKKGMKNSLIVTFLYNRAVKIPLIPVMIYYFGVLFTLVLTIYMIIFSILNGFIVEKLLKKKEL